MARMKNGMSTVWKVVLAVLAALLVLFLVAEAGIRTFMASQIKSESAAEVSFGSSPVTLGLLGGKFPHMTVDQPSTLVVNGNEFTGQPATTVELNDVRINGGEPVADSLHLTTELPNDYIRAMLNQQLDAELGDGFLSEIITVSDVTTDPEAGTFSTYFTAGAAGIELRPVVENEKLAFEAASTELFGMTLPDDVAGAISNAMADGVEEEVTGGMQVQDFTVIPGGLRVAVSGEHVNFAELEQMAYQP